MQKLYHFKVFWSDEDEGYIATCDEYPGLSVFGKRPDNALYEMAVVLPPFAEEVKKATPVPR